MPKFSVQKSITIDAPPEAVFEALSNFKSWPKWSPWVIIEPDCALTFSEDGESYAWDGKIIESGSMRKTSSTAPSQLNLALEFVRPWKSKADVQFEMTPEGDGANVTWSMNSALPFFLFWMKPMMIRLIGMDYDRGLAMLKDLIESGHVPSTLTFKSNQKVSACNYIGIQTDCSMDEMGPKMEKDMATLCAFLEEQSLTPSDKPFTLYSKWNLIKGSAQYITAFPLDSIPAELPAGIISGARPECTTYCVEHRGPYRHLANAWSAAMMHQRGKVFASSKQSVPFEIYENSPHDTDENDLVTAIHLTSK